MACPFRQHKYSKYPLFVLYFATSDKGRISHYVGQLFFRYNVLPVNAEGVSLSDIGVRLQRHEIKVVFNDFFRLFHHLTFGNFLCDFLSHSIMHTTRPTCYGIQSGFKNCTENSRRNI